MQKRNNFRPNKQKLIQNNQQKVNKMFEKKKFIHIIGHACKNCKNLKYFFQSIIRKNRINIKEERKIEIIVYEVL